MESWTRGLSSLKENSQLCCESEIREQRIVLRLRTGLNGGERGQEQGRQAKKQEEEVEDGPRTNLNGGELVQSTFLVLTFAFALAFMATFVLSLILAFLSPFRRKILAFFGVQRWKKGCLGLEWNHSLRNLWLGLGPCLGGPEKKGDLSPVPAPSRHQLCEEGEMGQAEPLWKRMAQSVVGQDACQ